eukprot:1138084-Pelagomonas_calceolata.AAC.3
MLLQFHPVMNLGRVQVRFIAAQFESDLRHSESALPPHEFQQSHHCASSLLTAALSLLGSWQRLPAPHAFAT